LHHGIARPAGDKSLRNESDITTETVELRDNQRCTGFLAVFQGREELRPVPVALPAFDFDVLGKDCSVSSDITDHGVALRFEPEA
jgi:hypothetical protein